MQNKTLNIIGIIAVVFSLIAGYFILQKEVKMNAGIKLENMDLSVNPGDNFFDYATLGWRKNNPIPDDYTRYGAFEIINETNLKRVREIAETDQGKIGTLYKIVMNEEKLNADKTTPIKPYLAEIDEIKTKEQLPEYLGKMHTFSSAFWGDGVALDEKDSEYYLYNIGQGGLGLSRDYYFDTDDKTVEIRKKYKKYRN